MSLSDDLINVAKIITPLTIEKEYFYMKKPWEMILGGLILPLLAKEMPEILDDDKKALMEEYSKEKVIEFFTPKEIEKVVEKEVVKEVPTGEPVIKEVTKVVRVKSDAVKIGGKFRRIKGEIKKEIKKESALKPEDRDIFNRHWNDTQHLVSDSDPVCERLAKECGHSVAPAQVAGYFSHLCRLGLETEATRRGRIERAVKRGSYTVAPVYSSELLDEIQKHWEKEREDERIRAEAHAKLRSDETPETSETVEVVTEKPVEKPIEKKPEPVSEEDFDIKFM